MSLKCLHVMDSVLSEMGLTRKQITREDSIFRAVSEKLFYSQCHHERVKTRCLAHLERHTQEYQQYIDQSLPERLKALREGKIEAGHLEMIALSHMYRVDFIIFHSLSKKQFCLTPNIYSKKIHLCFVEDNHYDLIYSKETVQASAICQSIVYELLYKGVFGLDSELEEATLFLEVQKLLPKETTISSCFLNNVISSLGPDKVDTLQRLCGRSSPPVPYRIAKALHPALYRNVELDIVQEQKRAVRHLNLETTKGLSPGDKCQVVFDEGEGNSYHGHIQSIDELGGTVFVYIEELGDKRTVPAKCIRPLPLAGYGEQGDLPVTQINLLPYLKKNRRKKQHPTIPVLFEDRPSPSSYRPRRDSTCSSTGNNYAPAEVNVVGGSIGLQASVVDSGTAYSFYGAQSSFQPIVAAPPQNQAPPSSALVTPAIITPVPQSASVYTYPAPLGSGVHISLEEGKVACGPYFDTSPAGYTTTTTALPFTCTQPTIPDTGYCLVPASTDISQPYCIMSAGPAPPQGPVYWMPAMLAVPYGASVGQVNLSWSPPQDPYGRDAAPISVPEKPQTLTV